MAAAGPASSTHAICKLLACVIDQTADQIFLFYTASKVTEGDLKVT